MVVTPPCPATRVSLHGPSQNRCCRSSHMVPSMAVSMLAAAAAYAVALLVAPAAMAMVAKAFVAGVASNNIYVSD